MSPVLCMTLSLTEEDPLSPPRGSSSAGLVYPPTHVIYDSHTGDSRSVSAQWMHAHCQIRASPKTSYHCVHTGGGL